MTRRRIATYRLQLTPHFGFAEAQRLLPYVRDLGVSHVYLSPIFEAKKGSEHGYDVTDPTRIRAELGGARAFDKLAIAARDLDLGLLLDVVPNHMAASGENPYFRDVLEAGSQSPFAMWFDIDWDKTIVGQSGRVLLPLLHEPLAAAIQRRLIRVEFGGPGFEVVYRGSRLPVHPRTWRSILVLHLPQLEAVIGKEHPGFARLVELIHDADLVRESMENRPSSLQELDHSRRAIAGRLRSIIERYAEFGVYLQEVLRVVNGGEKRVGFEMLRAVLADQGYVLGDWHTDSTRLNWRRYLEINDLVAVRVEEPEVFRWTHELVFEQIARGAVDGVRVDHVDGLRDPAEYLERVRSGCARRERDDAWILAETMNAPGEGLHDGFDADGTTGYDFLNAIPRAFADVGDFVRMDGAYRKFIGTPQPDRERERLRILQQEFAPYVGRLVDVLFEDYEYARGRRQPTRKDRTTLQHGFELLTAVLSVGRTFLRGDEFTDDDRRAIERACTYVEASGSEHTSAALEAARYVVEARDSEFVARWQSLCLMLQVREHEEIRLNHVTRWLGFNEPGGDPDAIVMKHRAKWFHGVMSARLEQMPSSLNTLSTHDTRRSEDVRARLLALLEHAAEFGRLASAWRDENRRFARKVHGKFAPDGALEWLLYQTIAVAWPLTDADVPAFTQRLADHARKVAREARHRTNWIAPDADFEEAVRAFIDGILHPAADTRFRATLAPFVETIAERGADWSLAQVALRALCPGVPDLYQGQEFFDFSLGDPDNRRPVDFGRRVTALHAVRARPRSIAAWAELRSAWKDGRIKLALIADLLALRRESFDAFEHGAYVPLKVKRAKPGATAHDVAFARVGHSRWIVVRTLLEAGAKPAVDLVEGIPVDARWTEVLTGELATVRAGKVARTLSVVTTQRWPLPVVVYRGVR